MRGWLFPSWLPSRVASSMMLPVRASSFVPLSMLTLQRHDRTSLYARKDGASSHKDGIKESVRELSDQNGGDFFATSYHTPVMPHECVQALLGADTEKRSRDEDMSIQEPRIFVDGTLGGGGHAQALLQVLGPQDWLIGCDVDEEALRTATDRFSDRVDSTKSATKDTQGPYFTTVCTNFGNLTTALKAVVHPVTKEHVKTIDGLLLDLGMSSYQIDTPERGFAYLRDGPLDMRLGGRSDSKSSAVTSSLTAADLCNELDVDTLAGLLRRYGDEPRARAIAAAIASNRPLATTGDLASAISTVTPAYARSKRKGRTATLARCFQALRIAVNQEDAVLETVLMEAAPTLLKPGGRLVVLAYHSMEDRATKRVMRDGTVQKAAPRAKDLYGNDIGPTLPFRPVGKARKATEEEVARNSRARSATLRVAERTMGENEPVD